VVLAFPGRLWSGVAAIWFFFVGPASVLYAGWVLVIDRAYFPRVYVLPFVAGYLAYAVWIYRLGREHLTFQWTKRQWILRVGALVAFTGAFAVLYAPALLIALGLAAAIDGLWRRFRRGVSGRGRAHGVALTLAAFAVLFPIGNRMYLNHGVFYTLFAPEPPRLMENALFDVNARGMRGPEPSPETPEGASTVLLAGDSVTWGFPYAWADTFARHLGDRLEQKGCPVRLLNAGIPSQSIVQIDARVEELISYRPRAVVLMVGYQWMRSVEHRERIDDYEGGFVPKKEWVLLPPMVPELFDLGPRMTYEGLSGAMKRWQDEGANLREFRFRLERTVRVLKDAGVTVVLASHPALELDERIREIVRSEAERSGLAHVDVAALFESKSEYAFGDKIHPNREGHRRVAALLAEALEPILCDGR